MRGGHLAFAFHYEFNLHSSDDALISARVAAIQI
jgi:hypothetical protein